MGLYTEADKQIAYEGGHWCGQIRENERKRDDAAAQHCSISSAAWPSRELFIHPALWKHEITGLAEWACVREEP